MSFLEWLGRTLAVTLSLMVTLSIIGAIASIPSGNVGTRFVTERAPVAAPGPDETTAEPLPPSPQQPGVLEQQPRLELTEEAAAAAPERQDDIARWLEAITFALIALAGLMALCLLVMIRITAHLRRIADASAPASTSLRG